MNHSSPILAPQLQVGDTVAVKERTSFTVTHGRRREKFPKTINIGGTGEIVEIGEKELNISFAVTVQGIKKTSVVSVAVGKICKPGEVEGVEAATADVVKERSVMLLFGNITLCLPNRFKGDNQNVSMVWFAKRDGTT